MNRKEYVYHLKNRLRDLPSEEIESALSYINELFDDAGPDNEAQVINDLGSPAKFAAQIKADFTINQNVETGSYQRPIKKRNGWKTLGIIFLGILALPIGLPLALVFFILMFVLVLLFFILIFVLGALAFAAFVSMGALFVSGIRMFAISTASGMYAIGISLMGISFAIFLICGIIFLIKKVRPAAIQGAGDTYKKLKNKGGSENEIQ